MCCTPHSFGSFVDHTGIEPAISSLQNSRHPIATSGPYLTAISARHFFNYQCSNLSFTLSICKAKVQNYDCKWTDPESNRNYPRASVSCATFTQSVRMGRVKSNLHLLSFLFFVLFCPFYWRVPVPPSGTPKRGFEPPTFSLTGS